MKKIILIPWFLLMLGFPLHPQEQPATPEIMAYLPQQGEIPNWEPTDTPQYVKGDDLFLLINGGAEIYHEYGFNQAVAQGFKNKNGKSFNLEIYQMNSPEAAYGIYSFKTGSTGKTIGLGGEGRLEDYYLNFYKGNLLVTIVGFDSQAETMDGLLETARLVAAKINQESATPPLLELLPRISKDGPPPTGITYLKGNLGLFNKYEFDSKDIFHLKEGLFAQYPMYQFFLFQYPDEAEQKKIFQQAVSFLKQNSRFKNFTATPKYFAMIDQKGRRIRGEGCGQYVFIVILEVDHPDTPAALTRSITNFLTEKT